MENYGSNSHKSKELEQEEKKEIRQVTKGNTAVKKETVSKKFADTFLADNITNVKSYVIFDVIVPAITDAIVDAATTAITMLFKGSPTAGKSRSRNGRTQYNTLYSRPSDSDKRPVGKYPRSKDSYTDIVFEERGDALEILKCIREILEHYDMISVAEFYSLSGNDSLADYTDNKRGWYSEDIDSFRIVRDRDGYRIEMPRPERFD